MTFRIGCDVGLSVTIETDKHKTTLQPTKLSGIHSVMVPPDPIPNSEVKRGCADGSVGSPHVRVGQCQTFN